MTNVSVDSTPASLEWHYSKGTDRFGPVPEAQIVELINKKEITDQSLVWNRTMSEWQPILDSKFGVLLRDPNVPPPLFGSAVSNATIWISLAVFAVGPPTGVDEWWAGKTGIPHFATLFVNMVLTNADSKRLKTAGHDVSTMWTPWLVPVYLFNRARILKQNYAYFIIWCLLFVLMLAE